MKTKILALATGLMTATALASVPAKADVKIGLLGGISGPIAAMAPAMIDAAQLAFQQVNEQGGIGDGEKLVGVVGDSACNPQNGTDAATKAGWRLHYHHQHRWSKRHSDAATHHLWRCVLLQRSEQHGSRDILYI